MVMAADPQREIAKGPGAKGHGAGGHGRRAA